MKLRIALALAVSLHLVASARAQSSEQGGVQLETLAATSSDYAANDSAYAVAAHGGVAYIAGEGSSPYGSRWLIRARSIANGAKLWSVDFALQSGMFDAEVKDVALAPDGTTLYVAGRLAASSPFDTDATVLALDTLDGSIRWVAQIDGAGAGDEAAALAISPDGQSLALTGHVVDGTPGLGHRLLVAVLEPATGDVRWDWRFDADPATDDVDKGVDVAFAPDGAAVFACGIVSPPQSGTVYGTYALASATGQLAWSHHYTGAFATESAPLELSTNGSQVVVVGRHEYTSSSAVLDGTLALDASSGQQLWTTSGPGQVGINSSRAIDTDGADFFVAEAKANTFEGSKWMAVKLDGATGARLWESPFTLSAWPLASLDPVAVAHDPATNTVLVAGTRDLNGLSASDDINPMTLAYDGATGAVQWLRVWDSPSSTSDRTFDLALDGARLVTVGSSFVPAEGLGMGVRCREIANGNPPWSTIIQAQGAAADRPDALVIDPQTGDPFSLGMLFGGAKAVAKIVRIERASGATLWSYVDDPGTVSGGTFLAGRLSADGHTLYALGYDGEDVLAVALDAHTGALLWRRTIDGPAGRKDRGRDLLLSADGQTLFGLATVDSSTIVVNPGEEEAMLTLALDAASGADLWSAVHDPTTEDEKGLRLVLSPDGSKLFSLGTRDTLVGAPLQDDIEVAAYDAASGAFLWAGGYSAGAVPISSWNDKPLAGRVSDDGARLAIVGASDGSCCDDGRAALWVVDTTNGALILRTLAPLPGEDFEPRAAAFTPDGSRAVAVGNVGSSLGTGAVAIDIASGLAPWASTYPLGGPTPPAVFTSLDAVVIAADGATALAAGRDLDHRLLTMGIDVASGTELWRAVFDPPGATDAVTTKGARAVAYDDLRRLVWTAGDGPLVGTDVDGLVLGYRDPTLLGQESTLSLSAGGSQALTARAGPNFAGDFHLLLGSLTGTTPGLPLGIGTLPLNVDSYTQLTLSEPGSSFLPGSLGVLDSTGSASLALVVPAGTNPALAGLTVHHAFVALHVSATELSLSLVSNAIGATLVP
ncbi:PQQ-binding-like beta-propeller repeat protein [Engelhardtia mirabilis]|uniref:Outer membrane biogenesis protein BamB n=1 Tax=Engelhardtia mirabilis TaxID=2528011 RepID=A0A518BRS0_9BACT|nr:outer membrane biogenesis protein BamB [Planctomycetes bacterium Pla133]QDV03994.1 outer membrane biogenesis protein BamB [Planctomycetes bacterium Pla86]